MSLENKGFEFGEFFLDTEELLLKRNGEPVPLTPKAYDLILELVKHSGHIVSKDYLMDSVWAGSIVEEGNLPFTIRMLRKALDDDAGHPRFIETTPRRGYRFVAEVKETSDGQTRNQVNGYHIEDKIAAVENGNGSNSLPQPSGQLPKRAPSQKFRYIFVLSILAVLVFGALAFYPWKNANIAETKSGPKIPFQNPQITKLSNGKALQTALSPDGKQVAYVLEGKEGQSLWLRR